MLKFILLGDEPTVGELIEKLQQIENKDLEVFVHVEKKYGNLTTIAVTEINVTLLP